MAVVRGFVVFLKYDITGFGGLRKALLRLSSAGEFHPNALQEPYVTVSRHTALLT